MAGLPNSVAGTKRPHDDSSTAHGDAPQKKRRVVHSLRHVQKRPKDVEPAPQDPVFAQGQLLKSISSALVMAGFDSVKPSALEMFRSHVEEYMLRFLTHARTSMQGGRRTNPTALDFASALSQMPSSYTASLLKPQLAVEVPEDISYPSVPDPAPAPASAPDFSNLLQPLIEQKPPSWIPKHFPALPPQHAWKQTAVYPEREKDARKMREKATQEGMLAEQALRKLAAAAKVSAINAEKRRNSIVNGESKGDKQVMRLQKPGKKAQEDTFAELLKDVAGLDDTMDLDGAEDVKDSVDLGVNHDTSHWRKAGTRRGVRV